MARQLNMHIVRIEKKPLLPSKAKRGRRMIIAPTPNAHVPRVNDMRIYIPQHRTFYLYASRAIASRTKSKSIELANDTKTG